MITAADGQACSAEPPQLSALCERMADLEDLDALHPIGPAEGKGIHAGTEDHILLRAEVDRLLNGFFCEAGAPLCWLQLGESRKTRLWPVAARTVVPSELGSGQARTASPRRDPRRAVQLSSSAMHDTRLPSPQVETPWEGSEITEAYEPPSSREASKRTGAMIWH